MSFLKIEKDDPVSTSRSILCWLMLAGRKYEFSEDMVTMFASGVGPLLSPSGMGPAMLRDVRFPNSCYACWHIPWHSVLLHHTYGTRWLRLAFLVGVGFQTGSVASG